MSLAHKLWRMIPHGLRRSVFETTTLITAPVAGDAPQNLPADVQIIVAGVLGAPTGLGEAARGTVRALMAQGRDVRQIDLTDAFRQERIVALPNLPAPTAGPGIVIVFANPPMSSYALKCIGAEMLAGKLRIGSWVWEYATVPARWTRHAVRYHRLVAPTTLVERAIHATTGRKAASLPYHVAAIMVEPEVRANPQAFRIGFVGDLVAAAGRKNPAAVVDAVARAFGDAADVELVMILRGARDDHPLIRDLMARARDLEVNLSVDGRLLDTAGHWARLKTLDAFCSLHRAEGFGLNVAEAMAAGIPTIATQCLAVADYLDADVGYPVAWTSMKAAALIDDPSPGDWAEPDIDMAAAALRDIRANPDRAHAKAIAAIARIDALYSARAVSAALDAVIKPHIGS